MIGINAITVHRPRIIAAGHRNAKKYVVLVESRRRHTAYGARSGCPAYVVITAAKKTGKPHASMQIVSIIVHLT
jgi:hypothetical protein